jgi:hypothetical protein
MAIEIRRATSPNRFVEMVSIPLARDLWFWKKITNKNLVIPRPSQPNIIDMMLGDITRIFIDVTNIIRMWVKRARAFSFVM